MGKILRSKTNILFLLLICYIFFFLPCSYADREKKYVPYPIVFISGIGTSNIIGYHSPESTWDYLIASYEKYFVDSGETSKYLDSLSWQLKDGERPHLQYFAYDSNEDIEHNTEIFVRYINEVLKRYYPDSYVYSEPCESPKVIIVAHSMGGIITRYMLTDYIDKENMRNKVAQVFLLGVPHLGSPLANISFLMVQENEKLKTKINDIKQAQLTEENPFSKLRLRNLAQKMRNKKSGNETILNDFVKNWFNIDPGGEGLEALLIPFSEADLYKHRFVSESFGSIIEDTVTCEYEANKQFLSSMGFNMSVPTYSIIGNDPSLSIKEYLSSIAYALFRDEYSLYDYSCVRSGYYNDGDGVVSLSSQRANGSSELNISAAHVTLGERLMTTGEYDKPETRDYIFNMIDNKNPIIKKISICPVDWEDNDANLSVYVVAKVEDYFLADIEIEYLIDNKIANITDLSNFENNGKFYPYVKFDKDFVKQHNTDSDIKNKDGTNRTLYPGEFYVRLDTQGDEKHTVKLKMKNPAGKESEEKTVEFQRPVISNMSPTGTIQDKTPEIKVTISSGTNSIIDTTSIVMTLDGSPVDLGMLTPSSSMTMTHTPGELSEGTHTVTLNGRDMGGLPAQEKTWTFRVEDPEPPTGYFIVEVPSKIAIDQNFTMKVTAYTADSQIMDGQEGRPEYAEGANITISGDPAPQGSLAFTQINSGGWINGVWEATNQCYSNSDEEKYKLTITVTDSGGEHADMKGSADTVVGPLELIMKNVGYWDYHGEDMGSWGTYYPLGESISTGLFCGGCYNCSNDPDDPGSGANIAFLYKIEIPTGVNISSAVMALSIPPYGLMGSLVHKNIYYVVYNAGEPDRYPIEGGDRFPVKIKIDYSFTQPVTPIGEHNLVTQSIGGILKNTHSYLRIIETGIWEGSKNSCTYIQPQPVISNPIPVSSQDIRTVWISIYISDFQSVTMLVEPHALDAINARNSSGAWGMNANAEYGVTGIYGIK